MSIPALGKVGVVAQAITGADEGQATAAAREVEALGYGAIWLPGGASNHLPRIEAVLAATSTIPVASGVLPVDQVSAVDAAETAARIGLAHPGRFILGLGGAYGPSPVSTLATYFDALDRFDPPVSRTDRVLAALGPHMLDLARERAAGAHPFLVDTDYTATARARLGDGPALVVGLFAVLDPTGDQGRQIARATSGALGAMPAYANNFERMGYSAEEVTGGGDRFIDQIFAIGDEVAIATRVNEHLAAGATQVAVAIASVSGDPFALEELRRLAPALLQS